MIVTASQSRGCSLSWRILLILGFLLATLPVASHLLARAAVRESNLVPDASQVRLIGDDPAQASKPGSRS
ncbi:MAG: monovalent cation/H(+) antiporter subunit G [Serpentinimonas sp.]|nr:monovalent cation/H(+) antiporter subunit G [Serpentinimonas sp.]MDO9612533.1 monovalent cation/H(+) antiporter subunit G [Serpentinimonas sp.]